jgi:hypothetical protein
MLNVEESNELSKTIKFKLKELIFLIANKDPFIHELLNNFNNDTITDDELKILRFTLSTIVNEIKSNCTFSLIKEFNSIVLDKQQELSFEEAV